MLPGSQRKGDHITPKRTATPRWILDPDDLLLDTCEHYGVQDISIHNRSDVCSPVTPE